MPSIDRQPTERLQTTPRGQGTHSGVDELLDPDAAAKMPFMLLMKLDAILAPHCSRSGFGR